MKKRKGVINFEKAKQRFLRKKVKKDIFSLKIARKEREEYEEDLILYIIDLVMELKEEKIIRVKEMIEKIINDKKDRS